MLLNIINNSKIISIIFILLNLSCIPQSEDNDFYDIIKVEIPGVGGTEIINLGSGDWVIVSVLSKSEEHKIKGNIYDVNNVLVKENKTLELAGFGMIESSGIKVGFDIKYKDPDVLEIQLRENASDETFGFVIVLQNDGLRKKIHVDQIQSDGYTFENIEFFLEEQIIDSIYTRYEVTTYKFDLIEPKEILINPFNGSDVIENSYFTSKEKDAFLWLVGDSIEVKVPEGIQDGILYFSDKTNIYGTPFNQPYYSDSVAIIEAPIGESIFYSNLVMRKRTVHFKLKMRSRSTSEIKEINGKWIETSPTGSFEIIKVD